MGYPSSHQILDAAKTLSLKENGSFVRTNGLWHVLMFLRHRACHQGNASQTFEAYDLAQAAFDLSGVCLPIEDESRCVYFEPGATQGNEISKMFRHREGPRQTFLNRIYTGLVGGGPRQPKLFSATNNALPTTISLVENWIDVLRDLGDNKLILDDHIQSLIAWLFRFGIPKQGDNSAFISQHLGNGCLRPAAGVVCEPIPENPQDLEREISIFLGLSIAETAALLPKLGAVQSGDWVESTPISITTLGQDILAYLDGTCGASELGEIGSLGEMPAKFESDSNKLARLTLRSQMIIRFCSSLLSKRFLILTGLAGSGKTKIAQGFSRWITPNSIGVREGEDCEIPPKFYELISIGADWIGSENLLGYPNGLDQENYIAKPALELILQASNFTDIPHFLILDEMNLSHVERYFADILSVIESGEGFNLYSGDIENPDTWRKTSSGKAIPPKVEKLPENIFIVGTVNVDETTYMFSPKVLDRANVIEFRMHSEELTSFLKTPDKPGLSKIAGMGSIFGKAFSDAAKAEVALPEGARDYYVTEMLLFFNILQKQSSEFGYRTAHESARFVYFYKLLSGATDNDPTWVKKSFDCIVLQKFLPKLHGSRAKLGPLLKSLWFLCVTDPAGRGDALISAEAASRSTEKSDEPSAEIPIAAPYPLSAEKICRMWKLLKDNGFASFAEA